MLVRESSTPLYLQLKELLEEDIKNGKYQVGAKLPSESELGKKYNVSRITIRQALDMLEKQGITYAVHGKGTFVKSPSIDSSLEKISTFGETLAKKGYKGFTKIIFYEKKKTDDFDKLLHGDDWESVVRLSLTGYSMDEPVVTYRSVIKSPYGEKMYEKASELEKAGVAFSTFDLYPKIGVSIGKVNQKVLAVNADEEIAKLLNLKKGDAVLVLDSVIMDKEGNIIEYKKGYYCTEKHTFNLNREL